MNSLRETSLSRGWRQQAWRIVLFHAAALIWLIASNPSVQLNYLLLPTGLMAVALLGAAFSNGTGILFTLAGFYAGLFWIPSPYLYAHDAMEAMMVSFGLPVMYAAIGGCIGVTWDLLKRASDRELQNHTADADVYHTTTTLEK